MIQVCVCVLCAGIFLDAKALRGKVAIRCKIGRTRCFWLCGCIVFCLFVVVFLLFFFFFFFLLSLPLLFVLCIFFHFIPYFSIRYLYIK